MRVDDAFVREVNARLPEFPDREQVIAATIAVAAERGMVVPEGAPKMWATFSGEKMTHIYRAEDNARHLKMDGETVVRVAIVEIKE